MRYTERYEQLRKLCEGQKEKLRVPDSGIVIEFFRFDSSISNGLNGAAILKDLRNVIPGALADENVPQNQVFTFPVFYPSTGAPFKKAVVLLHGLNERKWDKYLTWAHFMASELNRPVIVFPISFHISRSCPQWLDPRLLSVKMHERLNRYNGSIPDSSFINYTISERLTEMPQRFFLSGLQTVNDLTHLLRQINLGEHPLFEKGATADLFAYSIGGMLAQVMHMANPGGLLTHSKLFLFCAGSVFGHMNGISRVILDEAAHTRLQNYFRNEFEEELSKPGIMKEFFNSSATGMAFRSLLIPGRFRKYREKAFRESVHRIFALSFRNDKVIPPVRIREALFPGEKSASGHMEVHDFKFPYTHEVPFPVKYSDCKDFVDDAFEKVFRKAVVFLS